jgi:ribosomal protein S18 acetylase RimI-like enzyme
LGQPVVQLYVTASNERALRFYQREGFHQAQAILRRVLI